MRLNSLSITPIQSTEINEWARYKIPFLFLQTPDQKLVALGLRYDAAQLEFQDKNSPFHYCRGFYFAAAWSELGVLSGRIDFNDFEIKSTIEKPLIDKFTRDNLGVVNEPDQVREQQGVFFLSPDWVGKNHINWSFPYNDTFYKGAIDFGRPIYLASKRSRKNMVRVDDSGGLSVMGREIAIVLGSEAYFLHISTMGEVLVFDGARVGQIYGIKEMSESVERHTLDSRAKASLSWLGDLTTDGSLQPGEVVVVSLQTLDEDGQWSTGS